VKTHPPKQFLSSSEVARICGVSLKTAVTWIDSGRLPGYRQPQGCKKRMVARSRVVSFMKVNNIDGWELLLNQESATVACLGCRPPVVDGLLLGLPADTHRVTSHRELFSFGLSCAAIIPAVTVIDLASVGSSAAWDAIRGLRAISDPRIVLLAPWESTDDELAALTGDGVTCVRPCGSHELVSMILKGD